MPALAENKHYMSLPRIMRNAIGRISGYGRCYRCGDSWAWKPHKDIPCGEHKGVFVVCPDCYEKATPEELWEYLTDLLGKWAGNGVPTQEDIKIICQARGWVSRNKVINKKEDQRASKD